MNNFPFVTAFSILVWPSSKRFLRSINQFQHSCEEIKSLTWFLKWGIFSCQNLSRQLPVIRNQMQILRISNSKYTIVRKCYVIKIYRGPDFLCCAAEHLPCVKRCDVVINKTTFWLLINFFVCKVSSWQLEAKKYPQGWLQWVQKLQQRWQ